MNRPGESPDSPGRFTAEDMVFYPGGVVVRLGAGTDATAVTEKLRERLRAAGWHEWKTPTEKNPDKVMFEDECGFTAFTDGFNPETKLPIVDIEMWSACATIPEGFNRYVDRL